MSYTTALVWSFGRSVVISATAAVMARSVNCVVSDLRGVPRFVSWSLLVIPWMIPGLLLGYAWNGWVFALKAWSSHSGVPGLTRVLAWVGEHDSAANELVLCCLLFFRCLPWAVIMLRWGVRVDEAESSWFLRGLASDAAGKKRGSPVGRFRRGFRLLAPAMGLAFLTCFQEFELVARLGRPSWTVWLIDAHATGVALAGLLSRAIIAAALQTALVFRLLPVRRGLFSPPGSRPRDVSAGGGRRVVVLGLTLFGAIATVAVPFWSLRAGWIQGMSALVDRTPVLWRLVGEVSVGVAVAMIAAAAAIMLARLLEITPGAAGVPSANPSPDRSPGRGVPGSILHWVHWGMFWLGAWGAVPLCLVALWGLAESGVSFLNQTVFPWCLVLSVWLFPRAVCLVSLIRAWRQPQSAHLGTLLAKAPDGARRGSAQQLWWRDNWRNPVMAGLFLAMTGYFDLPTGQILAPAGLVSAPVTLYTQMHYGRNSLLTAMTLLAVAIPWTLAILALMVLPRLTIWRRGRSISLGGWIRSL